MEGRSTGRGLAAFQRLTLIINYGCFCFCSPQPLTTHSLARREGWRGGQWERVRVGAGDGEGKGGGGGRGRERERINWQR